MFGWPVDTNVDTDFAFGNTALHPSSSDESPLLVNESAGFKSHTATDQALRKSCDRCYAQKLKCSRSDASRSRCIRCQRAGLPCFYSTRLVRQGQKRTTSSDNVIPQKTSRPFQQHTLPSPSPEGQVPFDPLLLEDFDLESHGLANSAFYDELQSEYPWVRPDWPILAEPSENPHVQDKAIFAASTEEQGIQGHLLEMGLQERPGTAVESNIEPRLVQINPLDELACLSRRLENFLHRMSAAEPLQDLQSYPIGETLDGSRRLLVILRQHTSLGALQCHNPYVIDITHDQSHSGSRTTNSLLALQCYIFCVKILATLCQKLLSHPYMIAESEAQAMRRDRTTPPCRESSGLPTPEERPNNPIDEALSIPLHSNLLLGELDFHLNPFGHTLNCVCGALSAGFKLLRGIEATLGISTALGVSYESLLMNVADRTDISDGGGPMAIELTTPVPSLARCADDRNRHLDARIRSHSGNGQSLLERLITVLWEEEATLEASTGSQETALAVLRRCSKQIYELARQHALFSH